MGAALRRITLVALKSTARAVARLHVPMLELAEGMGLVLKDKELRIDASVAIRGLVKRRSRLLSYMRKCPGVDLGWLGGVIDTLGIKIVKEPTATNVADGFTKALSGETFRASREMLGEATASRHGGV